MIIVLNKLKSNRTNNDFGLRVCQDFYVARRRLSRQGKNTKKVTLDLYGNFSY